MGWETGVSLGAAGVGAFENTETAKAQSKAIQQTAEYTASNLANKTARTEGTLETSFLKGGIALTGAGGPAAFFQQAAAQGQTDIQRTIDNANASISNTMSAARTKSLDTVGSAFGKLGTGTIVTAANAAWNGLTGNLDPSPQVYSGTGMVGPFQNDPLPWSQ